MKYAKIDNENNVINIYDVDNNEKTLLICPDNVVQCWTYNDIDKLFTQLQPFNSWILQTDRTWQSPTPYPNDAKAYCWIEKTKTWKEICIISTN